jgi:4-amino-4-deoxy-L-arabinose transferase-like glycosyltransferase
MRINTDRAHSRSHTPRVTGRVELTLLVVLLLIAAFLRFHRADTVPPGASHDELRMMQLGELIVEGERPIHWTISYSAEPLFMYVLALVMPVLGFTPFAARIVARFVGLLLIPLAHRLAGRLFGRRVALVTSGVLALTWWPVFFSRVALRGLTLPLVFVPAVYSVWRGLDLDGTAGTGRMGTMRWSWLAMGGGLIGLTWYTFTAARGLFILLPALLAYLVGVRLAQVRQLWRAALMTLGLASLVAFPFVYDVQVHPGAPEARIEQLSPVIDELRAGNLVPFVRQTASTVGMLISTGDPNWRYNVSNRPTFGPLLGTMAILGLLACIAHWKQPRHFLLLLWLALGWAPSMLTPEAPSFVRAIGALPAAAMTTGIGAVTLWDWTAARTGRQVAQSIPALLALLLVLNGLSTFQDLFTVWPIQARVREIYQASLTEALRALNRSDLEGPIWISEPFPDDRNLLLVQRILQREEIQPRWFDADRALILPPATGSRHYLLGDFVAPDSVLFARWMGKATVVLQGDVPDGAQEPAYRLYQVEGGPWLERELTRIAARSRAFTDLGAEQALPLPAHFENTAALLGYELLTDRLTRGQEVHVVLYWRAFGPIYEPLSSFAHLLDLQSNVVGQYDGFDVPAWYWEPEAAIAQVYRFPVSQDAQPGFHWLEVGLYNPQTMERVHIIGKNGTPLDDRLLLSGVTVQ